MSMETDLTDILLSICPDTFPDVAPLGTAAPYVTWQILGGSAPYYLDNTPADKRNPYLQVSVWGKSRREVFTLIRQVEAALACATTFTATPEGEPMSTYESDTKLSGAIQRFDVWAAR